MKIYLLIIVTLLLPQQTQDFFADSLEVSTTDPQEGPSSKKSSLYSEEYLKVNTNDESSDSDVTPDLDLTTTSICVKNDREQMNKTILNWNLTPEDSDDSDKSDHTLTPDVIEEIFFL